MPTHSRIPTPATVLIALGAGLVALALALALALVQAPDAHAGGGRLDAALDKIIDDPQGPPGLSVIVQRRNRVDFRRRGVANMETGAKPKIDSPMRIASMAKAFNGAIALSLVSKGKLDLDDTVGEWLPGVWPKADAVTIREMLAHTAGLPDYIHQQAFIDELIADPAQYMTPLRADRLRQRPRARPRPGRGLPLLRQRQHHGRPDRRGCKREELQPAAQARDLQAGRASTTRASPTRWRCRAATCTATTATTTASSWIRASTSTRRSPGPRAGSSRRRRTSTRSSAPTSAAICSAPRSGRARTGSSTAPPRLPARAATTPPSPCSATRPAAAPSTGTPAPTPATGCSPPPAPTARRSVVFSVNSQIVPGQDSPRVSGLIRQAQADAVCLALR